jgi:peptidoglycan hydrolase-like protein with peptidoglycan-binding domain
MFRRTLADTREANIKKGTDSAMRGFVLASVVAAILLCTLAADPMLALAQTAPEADQGSPASAANSPELVKRAQLELKRLDCLNGRLDGKLGNATRAAIKKFWASAKEPDRGLDVTEELIAALKERGDNYCRPPRPFFAIGGRSGGNLVAPFFAPGGRPPLPALPSAATAPAPSPAEH